jgi:hypothetical protein
MSIAGKVFKEAAVGAVIAVGLAGGFIPGARATGAVVTIDPNSLPGITGLSTFQTDNYNLFDFATISINDTTGAFTESGAFELTQWALGSTTLLSTDTGLRNGTGAQSYGIYITFTGTGILGTGPGGSGPFIPGQVNVGGFSNVTYTMLADPGNTDTVSPTGVLTDNGTPDTPIANGGLAGTGPNQVSVVGSIDQPGADVELSINRILPPDFFTAPVNLNLQEDSFTNTTSVFTVSQSGDTTTVDINGGGGNGTFAAVPEPMSVPVLGMGLLGLGGVIRRRARRHDETGKVTP